MFSKIKSLVFLFLILFVSCKVFTKAQEIEEDYVIKKERDLRIEIADFADNQLGSKYKYAGRSPKSGFDCSGFTYYVMKNNGITLPTNSSAQATKGGIEKLKNAKPGDLVFFKRGGKGRVFHVAMIYENERGNPKVIHSTSSRGVVIDELLKSTYWKPKIWQVRNVID